MVVEPALSAADVKVIAEDNVSLKSVRCDCTVEVNGNRRRSLDLSDKSHYIADI